MPMPEHQSSGELDRRLLTPECIHPAGQKAIDSHRSVRKLPIMSYDHPMAGVYT